jgi:cob(I)alamin adenosyltransferase
VDELNSWLGVVLAHDLPREARECLVDAQQRLFEAGAQLSSPGQRRMTEDDILAMERRVEAFNAGLEPLKEFILPGGGQAAAHCHVARTVVRRAERETVALARDEAVRPEAIRYLNRLSDLLFVLARVLARASGHGEVLWQHERRKRASKE